MRLSLEAYEKEREKLKISRTFIIQGVRRQRYEENY
jgi:hypothetical protein